MLVVTTGRQMGTMAESEDDEEDTEVCRMWFTEKKFFRASMNNIFLYTILSFLVYFLYGLAISFRLWSPFSFVCVIHFDNINLLS